MNQKKLAILIHKRRRAAYERANGASFTNASKAVGVQRETIADWERKGDREYWDEFIQVWLNNVKIGGAEALQLLRNELLPIGARDPCAQDRIKAASRILSLIEATMPTKPVQHQHLHVSIDPMNPLDLESTQSFLDKRRRLLIEMSSVRDEEEVAVRGGRLKVIDVLPEASEADEREADERE